MSIFDPLFPGGGIVPRRTRAIRPGAEEYAFSLGLTPGGPGWGDAIRDYVLNGAVSASEGTSLGGAGEAAFQEGGTSYRRGPGGTSSRRSQPSVRPTQHDGLLARTMRRAHEAAQTAADTVRGIHHPGGSTMPRDPIDIVMDRSAGGAESTSDTDRNRAGSSATGRHQFTRPTFVDNYRRVFPNSRETDAQILAHITDGPTQDILMRDRMERGRDMLIGANIPVTPGRLYMMHVAELRRGLHALQHLDEPITTRFTREEIRQNSWNPHWTNADLLNWADDRMEPQPQRPGRTRPAPQSRGGPRYPRMTGPDAAGPR